MRILPERIHEHSKVHGHKPTITVKGASSDRKQKKLTELGVIIRGTSYQPISIPAAN